MLIVPLIVFGSGHVGRAFLRQLVRNSAALSQRLNLRLVVVGLAGRQHMLLDPAGLDDDRLLAMVERLELGETLLDQKSGQIKTDNQSMLDALLPSLFNPPVVIDTTAAEGMG